MSCSFSREDRKNKIRPLIKGCVKYKDAICTLDIRSKDFQFEALQVVNNVEM